VLADFQGAILRIKAVVDPFRAARLRLGLRDAAAGSRRDIDRLLAALRELSVVPA